MKLYIYIQSYTILNTRIDIITKRKHFIEFFQIEMKLK